MLWSSRASEARCLFQPAAPIVPHVPVTQVAAAWLPVAGGKRHNRANVVAKIRTARQLTLGWATCRNSNHKSVH